MFYSIGCDSITITYLGRTVFLASTVYCTGLSHQRYHLPSSVCIRAVMVVKALTTVLVGLLLVASVRCASAQFTRKGCTCYPCFSYKETFYKYFKDDGDLQPWCYVKNAACGQKGIYGNWDYLVTTTTVSRRPTTGYDTKYPDYMQCFLNDDCYRSDYAMEPRDLGARTVETNAMACQMRCKNTLTCAYFSFWEDGACHLSTKQALPIAGYPGVIAGPSICPPRTSTPGGNTSFSIQLNSTGLGWSYAEALGSNITKIYTEHNNTIFSTVGTRNLLGDSKYYMALIKDGTRGGTGYGDIYFTGTYWYNQETTTSSSGRKLLSYTRTGTNAYGTGFRSGSCASPACRG